MKTKTITQTFKEIQGTEYKIDKDFPKELLNADYIGYLIKNKKGSRFEMLNDKITHVACYFKKNIVAVELETPFTIEEAIIRMESKK